MTLLFESLSLTNFGPYRSITDMELTTSPDAPIVVIHGENTLGKTSLFSALRWCLYGSPEVGRSANESLRDIFGFMNRLAWADGETHMQVSMTFTTNGQRYQLTRAAVFDSDRKPHVTADLRIDAQVISPGSIDGEIARILHPQISEFFLFDGELLRDFYDRLNTDRERDLLRASIENVLGIPALQLAEADVSLLTDDAMQRQVKALKNRTEADQAKRQLLQLKSRQESLEKDRAEYDASLRKAQNDLEGVRDRIAGIDELKADARELEGLEAQIAGAKIEETETRELIRAALAQGWLAPAAGRLGEALRMVVAQNDRAAEHTQRLVHLQEHVTVLENQVAGGSCPTCLQVLPPADESTLRELARARDDLEVAAAAGVAGPNLQLERRVRGLIDTSTTAVVRTLETRLNKLLREQFDRNRRLGIIKDRLKDNDAASIRQLGDEQDKLERVVERFEDRLRDFKIEQEKVHQEQSRLANVLRRLGGPDPRIMAEAYTFEYVQTLLSRTIQRYQERTRAEVERVASDMFSKLVRDAQGYSGLAIGADYRVDLIGIRGEAMKTSEGGKQLVALSLIGALKKAAVRGGPVVLDSPLARLDLDHRANVLQTWIPELGNQAVLLVQSGELTEAEAHNLLGNKIGHEYRISRPNNNPEEAIVERISIHGAAEL